MKLVTQEVIGRDQCITTRWSGGTTTEWKIYPPGASYAERRFDWRLSTAVLEDEHSSFTRLDGFSRTLLLLSGKCRLTHHGHYKKNLRPLQMSRFPGSWETESDGSGSDLNLMVGPKVLGHLKVLSLRRALRHRPKLPFGAKGQLFELYYTVRGSCVVDFGELQKSVSTDTCLYTAWSAETGSNATLRFEPDRGGVTLVYARMYVLAAGEK